jgi:hypothetical protein
MLLRYLPGVCAMLLLLVSANSAQAELKFKPGKWQLSLSQSISGMPGGFQNIRWEECLSQADPIPKAYLQARSCDVLEQKAVFRTLRYKMSCYTEHGTLTNQGKFHFGDFRIDGTSKSDMGVVDGRSMIVRYKIQGRRVGDCP